jgi:hypothetical protein
MTLLKADADTIKEIAIHRDELYPLYRAGHLPRPGGVYAQDARTLDYFRYLESMQNGADAAYARVLKADGDVSGHDEP